MRSACTNCHHGLVSAPEWDAWYSRRDDAEFEWLLDNGPGGFVTPAELLDERPDVEDEVDCPVCDGTGYLMASRAA